MPLKLPPAGAIATILLLAFPVAAQSADNGPIKLSPQQIGDIFCIARVGNEMAPVEDLITPSLKKSIAAAEKLEAAYGKKHPGENPPLGDGLPWEDSAAYAPKCSATAAASTADAAAVTISYSFPDKSADFADVLRLVAVPDAVMGGKVWRIDDVSFEQNDSMRKELVSASDE